MVKKSKQIGEYTLSLEIWHTGDFDELVIHHKDTYTKCGARVRRKEVPRDIRYQLEEWCKQEWWNYVDNIDCNGEDV